MVEPGHIERRGLVPRASEWPAPRPGETRDNPDVLFVLGMLALKEGRHQAAIDLLGRAIALQRPEGRLPLLPGRGVSWRWATRPGGRLLPDGPAAAARLRRGA